MKYKFALFSLLIFFSAKTIAVDELIVTAIDSAVADWKTVRVTVALTDSKIDASVNAKTDKSGKYLEKLSVTLPGITVELPPDVINKIAKPRLGELEVLYTPVSLDDENWLLNIIFGYGEWIVNDEIEDGGEYSTVDIVIIKSGLFEVYLYDAGTKKTKRIYDVNS